MHVLADTSIKAFWEFLDDDCLSSGAAIAFYTIFSLPPLLIVVLLISHSLGYQSEQVNRVIHEELGFPADPDHDETGRQAGQSSGDPVTQLNRSFRDVVNSSVADPSKIAIGNLGIISRVFGMLVLLVSATGIFGQLQFTLNRIWEVEPDPRQGGMKSFIVKRLLSAGMIVVIGFVLLVSLVLTALIDQLLKWIKGAAPGAIEEAAGLILNESLGFVIAAALFAAMFKLLPDAKLRWKDVWLGSLSTAFMFIVGKIVVAWYLRTAQVGSSWGASAASTVAALVWVYYSSLIVLYGAEFSQVWATRHGVQALPVEGAVRSVQETRHLRIPPGAT